MNIKWDAEGYKENFGFVNQYGKDVLNLITAKENALAVDLGCGNGALSIKLADKGYRVLGVDASEDMLKIAREQHPELNFQAGDAVTFKLKEKADVIFSNAVLHWIDAGKQQEMLENIAGQLKTGGELVCEFGGKGCAETVHAKLEELFEQRGLKYRRTFYFPTIGEYAPMMEKAGLQVEFAVLFDRPTRQQTEDGLADWIRMFDTAPFEGIDKKTADEIISQAVEELRPVLYMEDGWYVDYVRIRFRARKR